MKAEYYQPFDKILPCVKYGNQLWPQQSEKNAREIIAAINGSTPPPDTAAPDHSEDVLDMVKPAQEPCGRCRGSGVFNYTRGADVCLACNGTGKKGV
jgi:hypothetical protein